MYCIYLVPEKEERRRLRDIVSSTAEIEEEESEERRERKRKKRKEKKRRMKISSEELSVPPQITKLTAFFKSILDGELRKLESEGVQEEELKINLEEMLRFHAQSNDARLVKRDIALGFMQVLILKHEDIIEVEQEEFNGDIYLLRGSGFDRRMSQ